MIRVEIKTSGLNLTEYADYLKGKARREFLEKLGDIVYETMRRNAPSRTGKLRSSIHRTVRQNTVTVGSELDYAAYMEYGTRPHLIRPVNARVLKFTVGRKVVFSAYANHPGTRPQPFVKYAVEEGNRQVEKILKEILDNPSRN